jgi:hypothetical protein
MPKYKVLVSGWENHFRTFGLDKSDINTIKDILDKNQTDDIVSVYDEIETMLGLSGMELMDISRPNYNLENIWFEVKDSLNNRVLEFAGTEMTHQEEVYGEDEDLSESFDIQVDDEFENVMLVVDEYKGGLFELQIQSDTIPVPSDFSFIGGSVVMPDFDLDFISKILFKGEICIPQYTLDNDHKGTSIYMVNGDIM